MSQHSDNHDNSVHSDADNEEYVFFIWLINMIIEKYGDDPNFTMDDYFKKVKERYLFYREKLENLNNDPLA